MLRAQTSYCQYVDQQAKALSELLKRPESISFFSMTMNLHVLPTIFLDALFASRRTRLPQFESSNRRETALGKAEIVGMKEGYIEFLNKNPSYIKMYQNLFVQAVDAVIQSIKSGQLTFAVPSL